MFSVFTGVVLIGLSSFVLGIGSSKLWRAYLGWRLSKTHIWLDYNPYQISPLEDRAYFDRISHAMR